VLQRINLGDTLGPHQHLSDYLPGLFLPPRVWRFSNFRLLGFSKTVGKILVGTGAADPKRP
jgi:hypothetical protein